MPRFTGLPRRYDLCPLDKCNALLVLRAFEGMSSASAELHEAIGNRLIGWVRLWTGCWLCTRGNGLAMVPFSSGNQAEPVQLHTPCNPRVRRLLVFVCPESRRRFAGRLICRGLSWQGMAGAGLPPWTP